MPTYVQIGELSTYSHHLPQPRLRTRLSPECQPPSTPPPNQPLSARPWESFTRLLAILFAAIPRAAGAWGHACGVVSRSWSDNETAAYCFTWFTAYSRQTRHCSCAVFARVTPLSGQAVVWPTCLFIWPPPANLKALASSDIENADIVFDGSATITRTLSSCSCEIIGCQTNVIENFDNVEDENTVSSGLTSDLNNNTDVETNNLPGGSKDSSEILPSRKRKEASEWLKDKRKRQRSSGEPYHNDKGSFVCGRKLQPNPCLSKKCHNDCSKKCSELERQEMFRLYWGFSDHNKQREWPLSCINQVQNKRRWTKDKCKQRNTPV
ncbi:hypothetical protein PR048_017104 [Dryococelus australis]|uniref:Uncharacterized protein n=1 Tax=Dryococelus australis TaxID=614101 RepID=A0ABQ9H8N5_9NEOP|nr:hypothetical protein PR048_017104 [Dryococelus australis]